MAPSAPHLSTAYIQRSVIHSPVALLHHKRLTPLPPQLHSLRFRGRLLLRFLPHSTCLDSEASDLGAPFASPTDFVPCWMRPLIPSYIHPHPKQAARVKKKQAIHHEIRLPATSKPREGGRRMGHCPCFDGSAQAAEQERQRAEAERRESQDARGKAAEAAQRR